MLTLSGKKQLKFKIEVDLILINLSKINLKKKTIRKHLKRKRIEKPNIESLTNIKILFKIHSYKASFKEIIIYWMTVKI